MTGRPVVLVVARHEFRTRLRDRSLWVSTLVTMGLLLGAILLPRLLEGDPAAYRVALVAPPPGLVAAVEQGARATGVEITTTTSTATEANDAVEAGDVDAVLVGADRIVVAEDLPPDLGAVLQAASATVRSAAALEAAGIDPAAVAGASAVGPMPVTALDPVDPEQEERSTVAFVTVLLLYTQVVSYGFWVAYGVVEEKSSRVIEVLLSAVRPAQLLLGKVLGIGLLGIAQLVLFGTVAVAAAGALDVVELDPSMLGAVLTALGWFVLGYAFYAVVFAAVGATVSRQEDLQNLTAPLMILILASFFAGLYAVGAPADSAPARILSFLPPFSTIVMPPRAINGIAAPWEVVLSAVVAVVAIGLVARLAARLYTGAILSTGGRMRLRDAWRAAGR